MGLPACWRQGGDVQRLGCLTLRQRDHGSRHRAASRRDAMAIVFAPRSGRPARHPVNGRATDCYAMTSGGTRSDGAPAHCSLAAAMAASCCLDDRLILRNINESPDGPASCAPGADLIRARLSRRTLWNPAASCMVRLFGRGSEVSSFGPRPSSIGPGGDRVGLAPVRSREAPGGRCGNIPETCPVWISSRLHGTCP